MPCWRVVFESVRTGEPQFGQNVRSTLSPLSPRVAYTAVVPIT